MKRLARAIAAVGACVLLGFLLAGGCGLPTPSGIRVDQRSVDTPVDQPNINKVPAGPLAGASPADIVRQFLDASAADSEQFYAPPFLAPGVVWTDRSAATVYDPETLTTLKESLKGSSSVVTFSVTSVGSLSSYHAFTPESRPVLETYGLRRVSGQWRLSSVPPGVLLTPLDLARIYRPVRIYEFNPSQSMLVAEPGFVAADRAGVAGNALHALLTQWGKPANPNLSATRTLAAGLNALGSVVVQSGVATVDLRSEALLVQGSRRGQLISQIAATLGSVPGVFSVRILVEERPYPGGAVTASIPANLQPSSTGPVLALAGDGSLEELTSGGPRPVKWVAKDGSPQGLLTHPVASPNGNALAALRFSGGDPQSGSPQLVVADLTHSGTQTTATLRRAISLPASSGGREMRPQWLDANRILLAVGGVDPLLELADVTTGKVGYISAPGLADLGPLSSISISRDGTRAIAVSGVVGFRQVYLGRILTPAGTSARSDQTVATGWTKIPTDMADISAVSWSQDLELTMLGRQRGAAASSAAMTAELVELDGVSGPTPLPPLPAAFEAQVSVSPFPVVMTAPGRFPMIEVGTERWELDGGTWTPLSVARDASYP